MALNAQEIINYIADSPKKTPVKIYVNLSAPVDFGSAEVFGAVSYTHLTLPTTPYV